MPMASAKKVDVPKKYSKILRFGTEKNLTCSGSTPYSAPIAAGCKAGEALY